jgi:hypothetical protein
VEGSGSIDAPFYTLRMPVLSLFPTRVYTRKISRGASDDLNARLLRECRAFAAEDAAGIAWSKTN